MSGFAAGAASQMGKARPTPTGDDAVASAIVLTRADVPSEWKEVFDPPSDTNWDRVAWTCLDKAAAPPSGGFASANYIRDQALTYSFVLMFPSPDAAGTAYGQFIERWVPPCVCGSDCSDVQAEKIPAIGDQSLAWRFRFKTPPGSYYDLAVVQQGRALIFLVYRNRSGPFPVDLRDQLLRSMVARAAPRSGG